MVSRADEAKTLASRPDEAKFVALRPRLEEKIEVKAKILTSRTVVELSPKKVAGC